MREFEELRINNKVVYKPQDKQKVFHNAILNRDENGYRDFLYGGAAKGGKMVAISQLLPTANGYETLENIKVGDKVFSDNGNWTEVIWKSKIENNTDAYEIEFDTGEKILADAKHLWKTFNESERAQLLRHTDEFRERRKKNRASRAKEKPNGLWRQKNMLKLNQEREYEYLPIPQGTIRTTKELFDTLKTKRGRVNHTIRNPKPVDLPNKFLLIDPYLLGLWLGDGHRETAKIGMLVEDFEEIIATINERIKSKKIDIRKKSLYAEYQIVLLKQKLKLIGILNKKSIPIDYLRSSYLQRVSLLQGLMDTDGHCDKRGQCEVGFSDKQLAEDVHELVSSLGIKASIRKKELSKKNPNHGDHYRIKFVTDIPVFRLKRKRERQNLTPSIKTQHRSIVNIKKVPSVPMRCIQVANPDGMYLVGRSFIPTHNSHALRWEAHRNCLEYPNLRGLLIRSSFPELERTHLSRLMYDLPLEVASYNGQRHALRYSNGSTLEFGYGDKREDFSQYLSAEYDFILIDELTTIPFVFSYLLRSRLAGSRKDFIPFWACGTNPGDKAHSEVKAYFVTKNPDKELYPSYKESEVFFLPATVYDNLILLNRDPEVLKRLQQLSPRDQQKFLYGNWDIFEGQFFDNFLYDVHVIQRENYLAHDTILSHFNVQGSIDYGNVTYVPLGLKDHNGNVVIFDEWMDKGSTRPTKIKELYRFLDSRGMINIDLSADTNMWIPDAFDVEDTNVPAHDFEEAGFNLYPVSKSGKGIKNRSYRINCNDTIRGALHWVMKDGEMIVHPKLKIYSRCKHLISCISSLIGDPNDPDDIADGQFDHPYDGLKYLYMNFMTPAKPRDEDNYQWLRQARLRKMKQLSQQTTVLSE